MGPSKELTQDKESTLKLTSKSQGVQKMVKLSILEEDSHSTPKFWTKGSEEKTKRKNILNKAWNSSVTEPLDEMNAIDNQIFFMLEGLERDIPRDMF